MHHLVTPFTVILVIFVFLVIADSFVTVRSKSWQVQENPDPPKDSKPPKIKPL